VPPKPATHCENVLAELQANVPGAQGPVSRVAEAEAVPVEAAVVVVVLLNTGDDVVDVDKVVEDELSNENVFRKMGNCREVDELSRSVVLEMVGVSEEVVADKKTVVGTVITAMTVEEKTLVMATGREDGVRLTKIVVAIVTTSVRTSVEVDSSVVFDVVVVRKRTEEVIVVVFEYGADVGIADGEVVLKAVLFSA
jgi:hypothetical protein